MARAFRDPDIHRANAETADAPDRAPCALLLIDVINDLATLVKRARAAHVPVIYVNDNFGKWRSDSRAQVRHCLEDGVRGQPLVEILRRSAAAQRDARRVTALTS